MGLDPLAHRSEGVAVRIGRVLATAD